MSVKYAEFLKRGLTMLDATSNQLRDFASDKWPRSNHKHRIWQLSRLLGVSERRMRSIYNAEERTRLRAEEAFAIGQLLKEVSDEEKRLRQRIDELHEKMERQSQSLASLQKTIESQFAARQG